MMRLFLFLFCFSSVVIGQNSVLQISETYGSYSVGFKSFNVYDKSRSFSSIEGANIDREETISRPIQVSLWYPSEHSDKDSMLYEDYFFLISSELQEIKLTQSIKSKVIEDYKKTEPVQELTFNNEMASKMNAVKNANYLITEKFPVIIYGPSSWSTSFENALLFEFLASHGYIVVSSPSVGPESREMPITRKGIETQARDMEFLLNIAHAIPNANIDSIIVAGFSFGGLANVIMMARNSSVDAWIGLDPSIHEDLGFFEKSPYEDYSKFTKPMLFINSIGYMNDLPFYEKLIYSDAYIVNLPQLEHTDLASQFIKLYGSNDTKENIKKRVRGYNLIAKYILAFLNGNFKTKKDYAFFKDQIFNQLCVDSSFVGLKNKKGLPIAQELFEMSKNQKSYDLIKFLNASTFVNNQTVYPETDIQKLIFLHHKHDLINEASNLMKWYQKNFSERFARSGLMNLTKDKLLNMFAKIYSDNNRCYFDYDELNHTAQLLSMSGKGEESLEYFELNTELHPKSYKAYFNLGIGYFRMNDCENAKFNFEKCLKLDPDLRYKGLALEFIKKCKS